MTTTEPRQEDVQATFCAVVVDQWVSMGLTHAFMSPGSRSTPMALALAEREDLRVEIVHDERAAAFMALGVGIATGSPAVVLCTSGTAATHFHAAVVEADISGVPMIVCTADRPPEAQGVRSAQTINQQHLYGSSVRKFADAGVPSWSLRDSWRSMAASVFDASRGFDRGPVHLNLPFREPLVGHVQVADSSDAALQREPSTAPSLARALEEIAALCAGQRGVIVAGEGVAGSKKLFDLAEILCWPVIADSRSGVQHLDSAVCHADAILRHPPTAAQLKPKVVLQFGEGPASKVLNQFLHDGKTTVIQVSDRPETRDPWHDVRLHVNAKIADVIKGLLKNIPGGGETVFRDRWLSADTKARTAIKSAVTSDVTEPAVAVAVANAARKGQVIVASSSMPVRDLEWYARIPKGVRVIANRGANGIDGVLSTAIGVATATEKTVHVMIGDIALLHDSSSLTALTRRHLNMRIIVNNNDGGAIFSFLSQHELLDSRRYEQLFGTPHGTDIAKLCKAHGLKTIEVDSIAKLTSALGGRGVKVIVMKTDREANIEHHARINAAVAAALS